VKWRNGVRRRPGCVKKQNSHPKVAVLSNND